jgi:hypothetical protein
MLAVVVEVHITVELPEQVALEAAGQEALLTAKGLLQR